jgi:hypothetical protein
MTLRELLAEERIPRQSLRSIEGENGERFYTVERDDGSELTIRVFRHNATIFED